MTFPTYSLCSDTDLEVFRFSSFGKDFMKSSRCSPDGFVQMALQLAYFRWIPELFNILLIYEKMIFSKYSWDLEKDRQINVFPHIPVPHMANSLC